MLMHAHVHWLPGMSVVFMELRLLSAKYSTSLYLTEGFEVRWKFPLVQ